MFYFLTWPDEACSRKRLREVPAKSTRMDKAPTDHLIDPPLCTTAIFEWLKCCVKRENINSNSVNAAILLECCSETWNFPIKCIRDCLLFEIFHRTIIARFINVIRDCFLRSEYIEIKSRRALYLNHYYTSVKHIWGMGVSN